MPKPRSTAVPRKTTVEPVSSTRTPWPVLAACLATLLLVAAGVRLGGAMNDLWMDEIIALNTAHSATAPMDILDTRSTPPDSPLRLDGSHQIYTLYLYLTGAQANPVIFRLPSLLAGIGTVAMAWLIGRRRDVFTAIFAALLTALSYILVLYSSEARGYASEVFFCFAAFYALDRYLEKTSDVRRPKSEVGRIDIGHRWPFAVAFSAAAVLGLLSQLTFICFYAAALAWCAYRLLRSRARLSQMVSVALWCFAVPVLFLAWLYVVHINGIGTVGGTPSPSLIHSYGTALAWAFGPPATDALMFLACVIAVVALYAGIARLWREQSDTFVFYLGIILVFPILIVAYRGSDIVYVRFFLPSVAFLLLLCGMLLSSLYRRGKLGRAVCVVLLVAYAASNIGHMITFFQNGRGQYREAIRYMKEHAVRSPIVIAGDQDYRIGTELQYYLPLVLANGTWQYVPHGRWPPDGPEWLVCQRESFDDPVPEQPRIDDGRHTYEFVQTFRTAPLSGLHWFVYHNTSARGGTGY